MTEILSIDDLSVEFGGQRVVKGVNLSLQKGRTLALVGESGSGKSVTALSILQLLPYPHAQHSSGKIRFGEDILLDVGADKKADKKQKKALLRAVRGNRISMIFQEPMSSLNPLHSIEKQIAEVLWIHKGIRSKNAQSRIIELLELVGIDSAKERLRSYPHELSGGQRQRVMIAMALANEPEVLIADEPTTALDVTIQKQILSLLRSLQKKMDMAILLITHNLNVVREFSDDVAVMQQGEIVETASCEQLFTKAQHPYTQMLLDAEPEALPDKEQAICSSSHKAAPLLKCNELKVHFPIKKGLLGRVKAHFKAVDGISIQLEVGKTLGIVGESGSGKSTLAQALLRLVDSQGEIEYRGIRLDRMDQKSMRLYRKDLQIVFQDPYGSLSPRMSVEQIIEEGLLLQGELDQAQRRSAILAVLGEVGLSQDMMHRYPHEFSGGQRQRIAIARALVLKPKVLILDEPTSALDRSVQKQILELLRTLQKRRSLTYLFISHDLSVIRALCHKVVVMKKGKLVEQGVTAQLFSSPQEAYTKELINAALL